MANGHGGKRAGSGSPKGRKWAKTLAKEAARELVRATVTAEMGELVAAQVEHAKGIKYLVARDTKTGKFRRLTAVDFAAGLMSDEETIEVWEKEPNVPAFTDLMNRALDKPKDQAADVNLHVTGDLAAAIAEGRQRAAARNKGKG